MSYNILEARIEFKNGKPERVSVLVEISENDIRAFYATTKLRAGYTHIPPSAIINEKLLQDVAGSGMEEPVYKIFPKSNKN